MTMAIFTVSHSNLTSSMPMPFACFAYDRSSSSVYHCHLPVGLTITHNSFFTRQVPAYTVHISYYIVILNSSVFIALLYHQINCYYYCYGVLECAMAANNKANAAWFALNAAAVGPCAGFALHILLFLLLLQKNVFLRLNLVLVAA